MPSRYGKGQRAPKVKSEPRQFRGGWFRFYREAVQDPKVQLLPPHLFKTWVNLLCLAEFRTGRLPARDHIGFALRLGTCEIEQQLDELILRELIDILPDGSLTPHNWQGRQSAHVLTDAERARTYRAKNKVSTTPSRDGHVMRHEASRDASRNATRSNPLSSGLGDTSQDLGGTADAVLPPGTTPQKVYLVSVTAPGGATWSDDDMLEVR